MTKWQNYLLPSQVDEIVDTILDVGLDYKVHKPQFEERVYEATSVEVLGLDFKCEIVLAGGSGTRRASYMIVEDGYDVVYDGLGIDALRGVLTRFADGEY